MPAPDHTTNNLIHWRDGRLREARLAIAQALAHTDTVDEAAPEVLRALCEALDWDAGALWAVDPGAGVLRCQAFWQAPGARIAAFEAVTRHQTFAPGVGLPGRVWRNGQPAWIDDVVREDNFPRAPIAGAEGIHGAVGCPVAAGGDVLGVVEFFTCAVRSPDPDLLELMATVGGQLGQLLARRRAVESLRASEVRKAGILESALDAIITIDHRGNVVEFNPAAERTFGRRRADVLGRDMADLLVPPSLRARHRQGLARYLATGEGPVLGRRIEVPALRADGSEFPAELAIAAVPTDGPPLFTAYVRDITERKRQETVIEEQGRLAAFGRDVGLALNQRDALRGMLLHCAEAMVRHLGAAFARIWTHNEAEGVLELQASAGLYTHLDGGHGRVPVGQFKIGLIAQEKKPHLTNSVLGDPRVPNQEWARQLGLTSFAGYPLLVDDRVVGVMALFARVPLSDAMLQAMAAIANGVALGIERKHSEEALRQSEAQFRTLADSIPQLAWMARPDGSISWYNKRWYDYTGATPAEMEGRGWESVIAPEDLPRVRAQFEAALAAGQSWEDIFRLRRHDGALRWHLSRAVPVRDAGGHTVGWLGTNTDVTERREMEETLEARVRERTADLATANAALENRARQQADIARFSHQALSGIEVENLLAEAAARLAAGLDVPYSRVVEVLPEGYLLRAGVGWKEGAVGAVTAAGEDSLAAFVLAAGHPIVCADWQAETRFAMPQLLRQHGVASSVSVPIPGTERPFGILSASATQRRAFSPDDVVFVQALANVLATALEHQQAEEKARAFAVELQRSNRELEQFASVASHDLQEPLRKIQAFGDRLQARCAAGLGDQGREYLDRMRSAAARMSTLINDLLTFSRVTTRAQPFVLVDLGREARGVISDLEGRLHQTGGRVELGPLPTLHADPTQMRQLLQNLIGNGLKFHKPGEAPIVRVEGNLRPESGGPDKGVWEITVVDNGIGFEEKYLDRIFELFQRLHPRNQYEGTGIGLAICRKIVERHGGTITARSTPGQGTTFVVTLPASPPSVERTP